MRPQITNLKSFILDTIKISIERERLNGKPQLGRTEGGPARPELVRGTVFQYLIRCQQVSNCFRQIEQPVQGRARCSSTGLHIAASSEGFNFFTRSCPHVSVPTFLPATLILKDLTSR